MPEEPMVFRLERRSELRTRRIVLQRSGSSHDLRVRGLGCRTNHGPRVAERDATRVSGKDGMPVLKYIVSRWLTAASASQTGSTAAAGPPPSSPLDRKTPLTPAFSRGHDLRLGIARALMRWRVWSTRDRM